uniref:Plastid lipid-associated protein/fibrillin conserved domain-containing protein n=1 Tax=Aureoumbra lagunensis TaxID=44058 RepID=A0A6S8A268_9STRA
MHAVRILSCLSTVVALQHVQPKVEKMKCFVTSREAATLAFAMVTTATCLMKPAFALGPETMELSGISYSDTGKKAGDICAGRPLKVPGEKAAEGLLPKCVLVKAKATNAKKKPIKDAAVFGFVKTATGDSAVANNPDFRSDAGQFAMIPSVPPGENDVEFEFVAVIPDSVSDLGELKFESLKAISYPGGARMAPLTACELDSLSDDCDGEQEKFISK